MTGFIEVMKRVAVNAVEAGKPVNILFGTVVSLSPLEIRLSQQQSFTKEFFLALNPVTFLEVRYRV